MKHTPSSFLVAAFAVVGAVAFCHADTLPASAYIQDGLVVQYDGIENAGAGQHALGTNEAAQIVHGGEIIWLPRDMATMIMLR